MAASFFHERSRASWWLYFQMSPGNLTNQITTSKLMKCFQFCLLDSSDIQPKVCEHDVWGFKKHSCIAVQTVIKNGLQSEKLKLKACSPDANHGHACRTMLYFKNMQHNIFILLIKPHTTFIWTLNWSLKNHMIPWWNVYANLTLYCQAWWESLDMMNSVCLSVQPCAIFDSFSKQLTYLAKFVDLPSHGWQIWGMTGCKIVIA